MTTTIADPPTEAEPATPPDPRVRQSTCRYLVIDQEGCRDRLVHTAHLARCTAEPAIPGKELELCLHHLAEALHLVAEISPAVADLLRQLTAEGTALLVEAERAEANR